MRIQLQMADCRTRMGRLALVLAVALLVGGCAAGKAFRQGGLATRAGNLDLAVSAYRRAVQADPDNATYKIALERAMLAASRAHLERAKAFEDQDQLEAALGEYRLGSEYDPTNRLALAKIAALERTIRERAEAARPRPAIEQLRERARAATAEPALLNFTTPMGPIRFNNTNLRDVLNAIAIFTGINVMYDREVVDRPVTIQLDGATLEQALNQVMTMNQLSYKVLNARSIFVFPDTPPKHAQYDEQVIRTFYLSHADPTEMSQVVSTIIRLPGIAIQPAVAVNRTTNTLTVRATSSVVQIIERIIQQNDKPRAEIVVDVEILEVDRQRTKSYGLNLSQYALGGIFSPEVSPSSTTTTTPTTGTGGTATTTTTTGRATGPGAGTSPTAFNLNTISRGITTADFYMAVPTAIVRFLESDTRTKLVAKPQLRGAEGTKLTLNLGDEIPIISTSYTPIATGGAGVNPLSSYQYKAVGVIVEMTPRVTLEGDILLDLSGESSSRGTDVVIAGINIPSFGTRKVTTRLRLRDGEPNLLAGLLREDERKSLSGFPGAINVPVFRQLFSANDSAIAQTDIVMLLTPHIVRTSEISEEDLKPIFIGSQQNLGVGGPPPLIAVPPPAEAPAAPTTPAPPTTVPAPGGATIVAPPGTTPVPGTILVPAPSPTPPSPQLEPTPQATTLPGLPGPPTTPPGPSAAPAAEAATTPDAAPESITSPGIGSAQVLVTPPGTTFRVGGGPYTVPLTITNAARVSTVALTLTYDPIRLRVRTVQEGSFMRAGGVNVAFGQQVTPGRVDITAARAADATGASGTGLLAAVLFDAIAPGTATLTLSGAATGPGGAPMGLQFRPVTITVQ